MTTDEIMASIGMQQGAEESREKALAIISSLKKAGNNKKETTLLLGGLYFHTKQGWMWPYMKYLIRKNWGKL